MSAGPLVFRGSLSAAIVGLLQGLWLYRKCPGLGRAWIALALVQSAIFAWVTWPMATVAPYNFEAFPPGSGCLPGGSDFWAGWCRW